MSSSEIDVQEINIYKEKRLLASGTFGKVHLTDLLYYDHVLYPFETMDALTPEVSTKNQEQLLESGLVISYAHLIDLQEYKQNIGIPLILSWLSKGFKSQIQAIQDLILADESIEYWATVDRDENQALSKYLFDKGINVTVRYLFDDYPYWRRKGKGEVLGVIFSKLPILDQRNLNFEEMINFLNDEETKRKRRRLFAWQNGLETQIEKGNLKIEHVPELIATLLDDYVSWLKKSTLKLKYEKREFVYSFLSSFLTLKISDAFKKYFEFKKRTIDLLDDQQAPGREIAYLVLSAKRFS